MEPDPCPADPMPHPRPDRLPARPLADRVRVIAHRGASALRPEHTLAAYARAIEDGADLIEPDLVMTRDGVLVARHENEIGSTTDVAAHPEFADRRGTRTVDGERVEGWFVEDFTLAELRNLRARERLSDMRSTRFDGLEPVPTLAEIVELAARLSQRHGREIGLIPEIKHPTHFRTLGLGMEEPLLELLRAHPYARQAPVEIQSFETGNLQRLRDVLGPGPTNITLLQLMGPPDASPYDHREGIDRLTYGAMQTPQGLAAVAAYADAIGPDLASIIPRAADDRLGRPTSLVDDAHAAGLEVHPYTFRPENAFLAADFRGPGGPGARHEDGAVAEIRAFLATGIDAFFTDDPALGRRAVDAGPVEAGA